MLERVADQAGAERVAALRIDQQEAAGVRGLTA
jgi:hypothetical protein